MVTYVHLNPGDELPPVQPGQQINVIEPVGPTDHHVYGGRFCPSCNPQQANRHILNQLISGHDDLRKTGAIGPSNGEPGKVILWSRMHPAGEDAWITAAEFQHWRDNLTAHAPVVAVYVFVILPSGRFRLVVLRNGDQVDTAEFARDAAHDAAEHYMGLCRTYLQNH